MKAKIFQITNRHWSFIMNKISRLLLLLILLYVFGNSNLLANNLSVSNVTTTGQNTTSHYTYVQFDVSWDNS